LNVSCPRVAHIEAVYLPVNSNKIPSSDYSVPRQEDIVTQGEKKKGGVWTPYAKKHPHGMKIGPRGEAACYHSGIGEGIIRGGVGRPLRPSGDEQKTF